MATGTLFNTYFDYGLRGLMPLSFGRYYSTALIANAPGPVGWGFRHNFQHELRQALEGFVYIDANGAEFNLTDDGSFAQNGKLTLPAHGIELRGTPDHVELENYGANRGRVLVFVRRPDSRYYDLASIRVHPSNRLDLSYDDQYRLRSVTQSRSGYKLRFGYDAAGRITDVTAEAGTRQVVASFEYDAAGDLVIVRDPLGVQAQFQYDAHRMVSESMRSGGVHEFLFDSQGRCVRAAGPDGYETRLLRYDADARVTVVTDSKGEETTYEYNDSGQITKMVDPLGNQISYVYDSEGRPTTEINAKGLPVQKRYDDLGHLQAALFPDGTTFELEWNEAHHVKAAKDPYGLVWKYEYNDFGLLARSENPRGDVYEYSYNDYGEAESVVTPIGATYRYLYDGAGHYVGRVDPQGHVTSYQVDAHGNPLEIRQPTGAVTSFKYDAFERVIEVSDPLGQRFKYEYDAQGRLFRAYGTSGDYVEYHYNTCGQTVAVRREDGVVVRAEFDTEPRRILSIQDGNGSTLRYTYDALGRPIARQNWDGAITRLEYDAVGNITAIVSPDRTRQEYEYDAFGQMVLRRSGTHEVTFEYDLNGNLTAAIAPDHELRWERDLYGNALAEIQDGERIEYQYNASGRRTSMKTPLGQAVSYEWNIASQLERLSFGDASIAFEYDPMGRELERHFSGGGQFSRRYDLKGRLAHEAYAPPRIGPVGPADAQSMGRKPTGFSRDYSYDGAGHLQQIRDSFRGVTDLYHDQVGQLRAAMRVWGQAEYFDYDAAGNRVATARLNVATPPTPDQVFAPGYGPVSMNRGELANRGAVVDVASVGAGNRMTAAQLPSGGCEFELNPSGFVVEKRIWRHDGFKEIWKYDWDDDGRLVSVVRPDGVVWKYEYDPLGRRVLKRGPTSETRYVWDGSRLLHALEDGRSPLTYLYAPGTFNLMMCQFGNEANFVLPDQSSSPSEYVRPDGVARWWKVNQTWGRSFSSFEGEPGFTGQWLDTETGLYYNHFRYYDPDLGRYLSPDPIGLLGGLNEYAYVWCPFESIDPDGLAKALGGGPFDYDNPGGGEPDLRNNRTVRDPAGPSTGDPNGPYGTRTVPSPNESGSSNGKCLAVVQGPAGTNAFVSGQGRPHNAASPNTAHTVPGQMGNWTHAEIQALSWIRQHAQPGDEFTIFVDRPFCVRCESTVPQLLADLPDGIKVTVKTQNADGSFDEVASTEAPHGKAKGC